MKIHNVTQGSPEWVALRKDYFTASEAAAMMGVSPYVTRTQLLAEKASGIAPDQSGKESLFTKGHEAEAAYRPIAEELLGDDLYPVTGSIDIEGLRLLASFDGLSMDRKVGFEHKLYNIAIADWILQFGEPPEHHIWQLEQQLLVSGAERFLFVTSNGSEDGAAQTMYASRPDRRTRLIAGWKQFSADLAAYVPTAIAEMPKPAVTLALPALFIHAKGEITTSNMPEYGKALAARLESVRAIALITDQDFSDAKDAAKLLRENIESARQAKEAMLAQTVTVGEAARMIDAWCEDMRLTALQLEKDVAREDLAKKTAMIAASKAAYAEHVAALEAETSPHRLNVIAPQFSEAIKGKRSFASMQDALDTMLANAKITADAEAKAMRSNLAYFAEHAKGHEALFADKNLLVHESLDYVALTITSRISKHQAEQAQKEEATRQRIRAEEQARAEADARAKLQAEHEAQRKIVAEAYIAPEPASQMIEAPASNVVPLREIDPVPAEQTQPCMKLCDINAKLSPISITADGLETLGFPVAATIKSAKLYHAHDFLRMCEALGSVIYQAKERKAA